MTHVLGIDIGTTGVKALLVSEKGDVTASATVDYPLLTPRPNWAEQNPQTWWEATVSATQACLEEARATTGKRLGVAALGFSGQMHSSVFLDSHGGMLCPAILWCDQRTAPRCQEITDTVGSDRLVRLTHNRALAGSTAPKIPWLRQHEPEVYAQVCKVPDPAHSQVYGHLYDLYRPIYATLRDFSDSDAAFVEDITQ